MTPEWVVALTGLGAVFGLSLVILLALANHGFRRILEQLKEQGQDIKGIRDSLHEFVTREEFNGAINPLREKWSEHDRIMQRLMERYDLCGNILEA